MKKKVMETDLSRLTLKVIDAKFLSYSIYSWGPHQLQDTEGTARGASEVYGIGDNTYKLRNKILSV